MSKRIIATGWFLYLVGGLLLGYVSAGFFYMFMPTSFWVEYESVAPKKQSFEVGEKLGFVSTTKVNRDVSLYFNDILYCKQNGEYEWESNQPTQHLNVAPHKMRKSRWPYLPPVEFSTTCKLESNIQMLLPMGYTKVIRIEGPEFEIVSRKVEPIEQQFFTPDQTR